ncbi:protein kinase family protein [Endozoicomonas sp.]|uniref:protein kinase family protein n=1 Tax=Endozoicomonas sp. TaxID=1892382 RepID=UPI003D9B725D
MQPFAGQLHGSLQENRSLDSALSRCPLSEDKFHSPEKVNSGSRSSSGHSSMAASSGRGVTVSPADRVKSHLTPPVESGFQSESHSPESRSSSMSHLGKRSLKPQEMIELDSDQVLAWAFGSQDVSATDQLDLGLISQSRRRVQLAKTPKTSHLLTPGRNQGARVLAPEEIKELTDKKTLLGEGSFGRVYSVQSDRLKSGEALALKEFKVDAGASDSMKRTALREIHTQIAMNHPNVASAIGFHTDVPMLLVMEKEPYVLSNLLNQKPMLQALRPLQNRLNIEAGILEGLDYLHRTLKLIHGDLKSGNVLLDLQLAPKIIDFSLTSRLDNPRSLHSEPPCFYMPQELTCEQRDLMSESTDICSAGLIMLELATGQLIPYIWMNKRKSLDEHHPGLDWLFKQFSAYFDQAGMADHQGMNYQKPMITDVFSPHELSSKCLTHTFSERQVARKVIEQVVTPAMHHDAQNRCSLPSMKQNLKEAIAELSLGDQQEAHIKRKRRRDIENKENEHLPANRSVRKKLF